LLLNGVVLEIRPVHSAEQELRRGGICEGAHGQAGRIGKAQQVDSANRTRCPQRQQPGGNESREDRGRGKSAGIGKHAIAGRTEKISARYLPASLCTAGTTKRDGGSDQSDSSSGELREVPRGVRQGRGPGVAEEQHRNR